jgi:hypothetical protein
VLHLIVVDLANSLSICLGRMANKHVSHAQEPSGVSDIQTDSIFSPAR